MFGALIIVFREVIEAGLIIGIVLAATRGVSGRGRWVSAGGTASEVHWIPKSAGRTVLSPRCVAPAGTGSATARARAPASESHTAGQA